MVRRVSLSRRMGSGKDHKPAKARLKNPKNERKTLAPKPSKSKSHNKKNDYKKMKQKKVPTTINGSGHSENHTISENNKELQLASSSEQLRFFIDQFQSAKGVQLSSLELESLKETCILEIPQESGEDFKALRKNIKSAFGVSWKEVLCEGHLVEGKIDAGTPAVLTISSSALRSIELLRGLRPFTKECRAVKLFSKHMKVEEQISLLRSRVNIASGTPSRIRKLIDTEALGLSRLKVLVLDVHPDVKGYSLFNLPQVRDEFWDLFKTYFYQFMVQGDLRICLYGAHRLAVRLKGKRGQPDEIV